MITAEIVNTRDENYKKFNNNKLISLYISPLLSVKRKTRTNKNDLPITYFEKCRNWKNYGSDIQRFKNNKLISIYHLFRLIKRKTRKKNDLPIIEPFRTAEVGKTEEVK